MRLGSRSCAGDSRQILAKTGLNRRSRAIGAEHRHRLGEMVERLALQLRQRREAAFERDLLGDVLVDVAHAAVGIRHGDHAQRAAVRQMPRVPRAARGCW